MEPAWKRWDMIKDEESITPPRFEYTDGDESGFLATQTEESTSHLIKEHWDQFCRILYATDDPPGDKIGEGYDRLLQMLPRLEAHHERVRERIPAKKKHLYQLNAEFDTYISAFNALIDEAMATSDPDDSEDRAKARENIRESVIGETFLTENEDGDITTKVKSPQFQILYPERFGERLGEGFKNLYGQPPDPRHPAPLTQAPNVPPAFQKGCFVQVVLADTERYPDSHSWLTNAPSHFNERFNIFNENETWGRLIDSLREAITWSQDDLNRTRRTAELLRIRSKILRNMLYRYETFGVVTFLSRDEASKMVEKPSERDHKRTTLIGRALLQGRRNGDLPHFELLSELKEWAADVIGGVSKSTVYNALKATSCWVNETSGADGAGLEQTIENAIRYAERYGDIND